MSADFQKLYNASYENRRDRDEAYNYTPVCTPLIDLPIAPHIAIQIRQEYRLIKSNKSNITEMAKRHNLPRDVVRDIVRFRAFVNLESEVFNNMTKPNYLHIA